MSPRRLVQQGGEWRSKGELVGLLQLGEISGTLPCHAASTLVDRSSDRPSNSLVLHLSTLPMEAATREERARWALGEARRALACRDAQAALQVSTAAAESSAASTLALTTRVDSPQPDTTAPALGCSAPCRRSPTRCSCWAGRRMQPRCEKSECAHCCPPARPPAARRARWPTSPGVKQSCAAESAAARCGAGCAARCRRAARAPTRPPSWRLFSSRQSACRSVARGRLGCRAEAGGGRAGAYPPPGHQHCSC